MPEPSLGVNVVFLPAEHLLLSEQAKARGTTVNQLIRVLVLRALETERVERSEGPRLRPFSPPSPGRPLEERQWERDHLNPPSRLPEDEEERSEGAEMATERAVEAVERQRG